MTRIALRVATLILAVGCVTDPEELAPLDSAARAPAPDPDLVATHVDALVGSWFGSADPTPMGAMPFGLTFAWDDEDLAAVVPGPMGFELSFVFRPDAEAGYLLEQTGSIPGGFQQRSILHPRTAARGMAWATEDDHVVLTIVPRARTLRMEALVDGELHAALDLETQSR